MVYDTSIKDLIGYINFCPNGQFAFPLELKILL